MGESCKSCGNFSDEIHKHHIVPRSRGGSNSPDNLVSLCVDCHGKAHDVSFNTDKGVVKQGISALREKYKTANSFFKGEGVMEGLLNCLQEADEALYEFIVSGMRLGVIDNAFVYGLIHPDTLSRRGLQMNFTQCYQNRVHYIYQDFVNQSLR